MSANTNTYTITFYRDHGADVDLEIQIVKTESDVPFSDLVEGDQDSFELVLAEARQENNLGDDWTASHLSDVWGTTASVPDDM